MNETLKIVLGYVVFFVYMGLVMAVGELIGKKFGVEKEICRKCEHLATSLSWLICFFFTGASVHTLIINVVGLVVLAAVTFGSVMKTVERDDAAKSYGVVYFGFSTAVVMAITYFVNLDFYFYTGIAYYCMALGDGLAPIFAKLCKAWNPKVTAKKTLIGALTVFTFSSLVTMTFSLACGMGLSPLFILSVGALAATTELFSEKCTDNLTVEFLVFGYLVLNYYGYAVLPLQWALVVAFPLVLIDGATFALTPPANCIAAVYLLVSAYFGGFPMLVGILSLYVLSAVIGTITNRIYEKKKGEKLRLSRNLKQILANSSVAFLCSLLYFITKREFFLFGAFVAVAEEFADAAASDIGKLSRFRARNILGFEVVPTGISGGITPLGTIGAFAGAAVAILIPFAFRVFDWRILLVLTGMAFFGTLVDSILGAALQGLYRCNVCGTQVEVREHCLRPTERIKGIGWFDNSIVNLASGLITVACTLPVLLLF